LAVAKDLGVGETTVKEALQLANELSDEKKAELAEIQDPRQRRKAERRTLQDLRRHRGHAAAAIVSRQAKIEKKAEAHTAVVATITLTADTFDKLERSAAMTSSSFPGSELIDPLVLGEQLLRATVEEQIAESEAEADELDDDDEDNVFDYSDDDEGQDDWGFE